MTIGKDTRPKSAQGGSLLDPEADMYYNDINFKIPRYVYKPLTRENSGIMGPYFDYGIFHGRTNYKETEKIALEHMLNLRSQYRKIRDINLESNKLDILKKKNSPYAHPTYTFKPLKGKFSLSKVAHAARFYPIEKEPRVERARRALEQRDHEKAEKEAWVQAQRAEAYRRMQEEQAYWEEQAAEGQIKKVSDLKTKKKRIMSAQASRNDGDINDYMTLKKKTNKKKGKKSGLKAMTNARIKSATQKNDPIAIREHNSLHDNINVIEEKDEKEEEDHTYTYTHGQEGNSQSKKTLEQKKQSNKNLIKGSASEEKVYPTFSEEVISGGKVEIMHPRDETIEDDLNIEATADLIIDMPDMTESKEQIDELSKKEISYPVDRTGNAMNRIESSSKSAEMARVIAPPPEEGADDENQEEMDAAYEEMMQSLLNDIPVLESEDDEAQNEFFERIVECINKYQIADSDGMEQLFMATVQKNPNLPQEVLSEMFEEIMQQMYQADGEEEEDTDHIKMIE